MQCFGNLGSQYGSEIARKAIIFDLFVVFFSHLLPSEELQTNPNATEKNASPKPVWTFLGERHQWEDQIIVPVRDENNVASSIRLLRE